MNFGAYKLQIILVKPSINDNGLVRLEITQEVSKVNDQQTAGITSPICSKEEILDALFEYEMEIEEYRLSFESVHEMLTYIKNSGVSGGTKQLSYKKMKKLILTYPLDYLEFEVIFVKNINKKILENKSPK